MTRRGRGAWSGLAVLALCVAGGAARAEIAVPAELPPPDYAGQQYVDSKGCLFLRAGAPGEVIWIPRVTRKGVPLCGNPPSGQRVPVVEEGAAVTVPEAGATAPVEAAAAAPADRVAGIYVAVGSFGVAANADKAVARLQALNYQVAWGRRDGAALVTVYAGPFASAAEAERARAELRSLGFPDAIVTGR